jgi:hypothetical protein
MNELGYVFTRRLVGLMALVFSALYLLSDVIEVIQGGFSDGQLWLTLIAEAAIPIFVIGLYAVLGPQIGRLGRISAIAYAYSYVFFTGTVVYALVNATSDYITLSRELQPWVTVHGGVMLLAGLGFGAAVLRSGTLPRWTSITLMAGVILVCLSQTLPEGPQLLAAAIRDLGFAGMGAALLQTPSGSRLTRRRSQRPHHRARHSAGAEPRPCAGDLSRPLGHAHSLSLSGHGEHGERSDGDGDEGDDDRRGRRRACADAVFAHDLRVASEASEERQDGEQ